MLWINREINISRYFMLASDRKKSRRVVARSCQSSTVRQAHFYSSFFADKSTVNLSIFWHRVVKSSPATKFLQFTNKSIVRTDCPAEILILSCDEIPAVSERWFKMGRNKIECLWKRATQAYFTGTQICAIRVRALCKSNKNRTYYGWCDHLNYKFTIFAAHCSHTQPSLSSAFKKVN